MHAAVTCWLPQYSLQVAGISGWLLLYLRLLLCNLALPPCASQVACSADFGNVLRTSRKAEVAPPCSLERQLQPLRLQIVATGGVAEERTTFSSAQDDLLPSSRSKSSRTGCAAAASHRCRTAASACHCAKRAGNRFSTAEGHDGPAVHPCTRGVYSHWACGQRACDFSSPGCQSASSCTGTRGHGVSCRPSAAHNNLLGQAVLLSIESHSCHGYTLP